MTRSPSIPPAAVDALRRTVEGLVAYPTDAAYQALRASHLSPACRPDAIVVPLDEAGVRAAVVAATAHGLQLAGRHADAGPVLLVLTHRLADVVVDVGARTAAVGPGTTWTSLQERVASTGLGVDVGSGSGSGSGDPQTRVMDSVSAGATEVVSARVVRADGFVHVVDDAVPPPGEAGTWVITAVTLRLDLLTTQQLDDSDTGTARASAASSSSPAGS